MLAKHFLNRVVWCAEALCRGGVGTLVLIDGDVVDSTNRNRQLPALHSTLGRSKVDVCSLSSSPMYSYSILELVNSLLAQCLCCTFSCDTERHCRWHSSHKRGKPPKRQSVKDLETTTLI